MNVGRALVGGFALAIVGCSLVIPFSDYDAEFGVHVDAGPDSMAPACVADLKQDRNHCGACGHSCKGAACSDGRCEVDTISNDPLNTVEGLAQDAVWLYGAGTSTKDGSGVARLKKGIKGDVHAVAFTESRPHTVVTRGMDIYWTEDHGVGHVVKPPDNTADPSPGTIVRPFAREPSRPSGIAVDDMFVYWANPESGVISRALRSTGTPQSILTNAKGATSIAADGEYIFWTEADAAHVMRSRADGSDVREIVASQPSATGLWVDASGIYFTTRQSGGVVMRADKDGNDLIVIAAAEPTPPVRVVVDGDYAYWIDEATEPSNGQVRRARRDGTEPPLTLAVAQNPVDLVVDETYVYWGSSASFEQAVRRVAK